MDPRPSGSADQRTAGDPVENQNPDVDALSERTVDATGELREENTIVLETGGSEAKRKELPEELSRSVMVLTCDSEAEGGKCTVYLVGISHVSQESCKLVQDVVSFLKPRVVFLELCSSRMPILASQGLKVPTMREMIEMWRKNHNSLGIFHAWFVAKVGKKLGVLPGSEFRVGYEEAQKCRAKVVLGDRPIQITLRRTWAKMPCWHKAKLVISLVFQAFFFPKAEDLKKMLNEMNEAVISQQMSRKFPTLMETFVLERDKYLSYAILRNASKHSSVVAVVGKGHLQGIKDHWKQPVDITELLQDPEEKSSFSSMKVIASLGCIVAGVAIISRIYLPFKKIVY